MSEKGGDASKELAAIVCTPDKLDELLNASEAMGLAKVLKASGGPISGTQCSTTRPERDFNCGDSDP